MFLASPQTNKARRYLTKCVWSRSTVDTGVHNATNVARRPTLSNAGSMQTDFLSAISARLFRVIQLRVVRAHVGKLASATASAEPGRMLARVCIVWWFTEWWKWRLDCTKIPLQLGSPRSRSHLTNFAAMLPLPVALDRCLSGRALFYGGLPATLFACDAPRPQCTTKAVRACCSDLLNRAFEIYPADKAAWLHIVRKSRTENRLIEFTVHKCTWLHHENACTDIKLRTTYRQKSLAASISQQRLPHSTRKYFSLILLHLRTECWTMR